jgi:hypothetical protein
MTMEKYVPCTVFFVSTDHLSSTADGSHVVFHGSVAALELVGLAWKEPRNHSDLIEPIQIS